VGQNPMPSKVACCPDFFCLGVVYCKSNLVKLHCSQCMGTVIVIWLSHCPVYTTFSIQVQCTAPFSLYYPIFTIILMHCHFQLIFKTLPSQIPHVKGPLRRELRRRAPAVGNTDCLFCTQALRSRSPGDRDTGASAPGGSKGHVGSTLRASPSGRPVGRPPKNVACKKTGSKQAMHSGNGRGGPDHVDSKGNAKTPMSDELQEDSDSAASGFNDSEEEMEQETESTATFKKKKTGGVAANKATLESKMDKKGATKASAKKKKIPSAKKSPKSVEKDSSEEESDEETEEEKENGMALLCTRNGGGCDGPTNIAWPGAADDRWTSKDFCVLVDDVSRRDRGANVYAYVYINTVSVYMYVCIYLVDNIGRCNGGVHV